MTNSIHITTNSPKGAQKRSECGVSGDFCGGIDGLQIRPVSLAGAELISQNDSTNGVVFMGELNHNKQASRIT